MDLDVAHALARRLMAAHGVGGWSFAFDRATRRLGSCRYATRTITLSAPLTRLNDAALITDTLLHEIAHALTPGDGHGPRWRATAARLGATPRATVASDRVAAPPSRYTLHCDGCGACVPRARRPRRRLVCRRCFERHQRGQGPRPEPLRVSDAGPRPRSAATSPVPPTRRPLRPPSR